VEGVVERKGQEGIGITAFQFTIRIDSIRFVMRIDSNRFVLQKKSAFRFTSCHAVFLAYLLYSLSHKNKLASLFAAFNTSEHGQKQLRNAYSKNYS